MDQATTPPPILNTRAEPGPLLKAAHLHAYQSLPEVAPDADIDAECTGLPVERFKDADRRTMRVVWATDGRICKQVAPADEVAA